MSKEYTVLKVTPYGVTKEKVKSVDDFPKLIGNECKDTEVFTSTHKSSKLANKFHYYTDENTLENYGYIKNIFMSQFTGLMVIGTVIICSIGNKIRNMSKKDVKTIKKLFKETFESDDEEEGDSDED